MRSTNALRRAALLPLSLAVIAMADRERKRAGNGIEGGGDTDGQGGCRARMPRQLVSAVTVAWGVTWRAEPSPMSTMIVAFCVDPWLYWRLSPIGCSKSVPGCASSRSFRRVAEAPALCGRWRGFRVDGGAPLEAMVEVLDEGTAS